MIGFIKSIVKPEKPIWISKFYIQYFYTKDFPLIIFWFVFWIIMTGMFVALNNWKVPAFFSFHFAVAVACVWFLLQSIHNLDRLYFFSDRIEQRFFYHTVKKISYSQIMLVLRDKESKTAIKIIYQDVNGSYQYIGGPKQWKIPSKVFVNGSTSITKEKLYPNIFLP